MGARARSIRIFRWVTTVSAVPAASLVVENLLEIDRVPRHHVADETDVNTDHRESQEAIVRMCFNARFGKTSCA